MFSYPCTVLANKNPKILRTSCLYTHSNVWLCVYLDLHLWSCFLGLLSFYFKRVCAYVCVCTCVYILNDRTLVIFKFLATDMLINERLFPLIAFLSYLCHRITIFSFPHLINTTILFLIVICPYSHCSVLWPSTASHSQHVVFVEWKSDG